MHAVCSSGSLSRMLPHGVFCHQRGRAPSATSPTTSLSFSTDRWCIDAAQTSLFILRGSCRFLQRGGFGFTCRTGILDASAALSAEGEEEGAIAVSSQRPSLRIPGRSMPSGPCSTFLHTPAASVDREGWMCDLFKDGAIFRCRERAPVAAAWRGAYLVWRLGVPPRARAAVSVAPLLRMPAILEQCHSLLGLVVEIAAVA